MGSILNTAISGINTMKTMIEKTVNKMNNPIENNKETRIFTENTGQNSHSTTITKVKEIYNNYNDFILEEKRKTNAKVQDEETKIEQLSKLEDLLCIKSNIFNQLIHDLYEETQTGNQSNQQHTINESLKEKLNNIIFELKDFDRKLKFLETDIKDAVIYNIKKVNTLIDEIHDTTINIRYHPILNVSSTVEDLITKRDDLVDELNGLIGIKVVKDNDSYKLCLNNGICIIDNNEKQNLIPITSTKDDKYISVGYIDNDQKILRKVEDMIPSATIGALLNFRKEELTTAKNKIGQFTVNLANGINSYPTLGYDVFQNIGKQIFNISNPEVISSSTNHSSPTTSSKWVSIRDAQDTDYIIYFKNNNWTVTRLSDYTAVQTKMTRIDNNGLLMNFDGIEVSINGDSADGDIYMVKPYSKTLEQLDLLIDQNDPLVFSSNNVKDSQNRNHPTTITEFNQNFLVDHKYTIDEAYQKFSRFISYKCNALEEEVPFKRNMVEILRKKNISMPKDVEKNYQDLNYEQECYLANVQVLKVAESIFNEIIECYS